MDRKNFRRYGKWLLLAGLFGVAGSAGTGKYCESKGCDIVGKQEIESREIHNAGLRLNDLSRKIDEDLKSLRRIAEVEERDISPEEEEEHRVLMGWIFWAAL